MEPATVWIGIDVSKEQLDVAVGVDGPAWSAPNDDTGIKALVQDFVKVTPRFPQLGDIYFPALPVFVRGHSFLS